MTSPPGAILVNSGHVDLSTRFQNTTTVVASPSANTETTIASITITNNVSLAKGIQLYGWAAFTVGTSGVSANLRIRQTNTSGSVIVATGAQTVSAGNLLETGCQGFDSAAVIPGQTYVLTLTIGSGAAASTVSAVQLVAELI